MKILEKIIRISPPLAYFFSFTLVAHAQTGQTYQMLERDIPGIGVDGVYTATRENFGQFINSAFTVGITVAILLAVIMLVIGGIEYMGSESVFSKESAKKKFYNAIWGLVLALGIYLFLSTINPNLIRFNLTISTVDIPTAQTVSTTGIVGGATVDTFDLAAEDGARNFLRPLVNVPVAKCERVGQQSCTLIFNLSQLALNSIKRLADECRCSVISLTGGTEYWLHGNRETDLAANRTDHRPGGTTVDFSKYNGAFNDFITRNAASSVQTNIGRRYYLPNYGYFLDEMIARNPPHWHVTFNP